MSVIRTSPSPQPGPQSKPKRGYVDLRLQTSRVGFQLLLAMVALMWVLQVINSVDSYRLDTAAGIYPRSLDHLWAIFTAPFLHASFGHLISNTVPFVFLGLIIAWRGAARLALITLIVIVIGGLGTWLLSPGGDTVGASGIVFGYATYLLARGIFNRRLVELLTGAIVALVWGWVLIISLVPQPHVSWEGHVSGAVGGVVAAWLLRRDRTRQTLPQLRRRGLHAET